MSDGHSENSVAATGLGVLLAGVLSMFARSGDDVARVGAHCVDDVSRACVTNSDDIAPVIGRHGNDLFHPVGDFRVPNHVNTVRLNPAPPRFVAQKSDEGLSGATHIAKEIAEATIKEIDLNDGEDN